MRTHSKLPAALAALLLPITVAAQEMPRGALGPAGTVTLSRAEYDRLLDLANRKPAVPDVAPVPAALTRADLRVRVDGSVARATMQVEGEVFRNGVAKVPLIKGATLLEARSENRPLPVVAEGDLHVALLSGPSTFAATLEVGTALTFTPGRGAFVLPVPIAGSATATIDVPGEQTDVHLSSGILLRRSSAGGRTTVEATLDPGTPTQVWWSTRDTAPTTANPRDIRLLSDVKTLVTIGDADVRLVTLLNVSVVQGEAAQIEVALPAGYEVGSISGASLDRSDTRPDRVVLFVTNPAQKRHQFLISLERQNSGGSFRLETGFPTLTSAQREAGEVAIEGLGTLEVTSAHVPGLRRMDIREVDPALVAAARQPLLAAYRYQRTSDLPPALALDVRRFPDAAVLAAVAERGVATTLLTAEGRALTEVTLWMRNRAQPFMKVALPEGASLLSVEVGGAPAKPVEGKDGTRVPLLRPGFRTDGLYAVSFVYLHAGVPFAKKGDMQMTLAKMDVPVNVLEWELFIPDRYRVDRFDGNALAADLIALQPWQQGQIVLEEAVTIVSQAPPLAAAQSPKQQATRESAQAKSAQANEPSANVQNLQRRASGVLPVRMDVPRAGTSHRFVKPLVIDEPTLVSFRYRRR